MFLLIRYERVRLSHIPVTKYMKQRSARAAVTRLFGRYMTMVTDPTHSQIKYFRALVSCFFKIHFNITLIYRYVSQMFVPSGFSLEILYAFIVSPIRAPRAGTPLYHFKSKFIK